MQKLYSFFMAFVAIMLCQSVAGQQLLVQDFGFSGALTANGWTAHSAAGINTINTTTGLAYTGYAGSGVGNAALVGNAGGEDVNTPFASQNANGQSVYYALLVNVNEATDKTGDYFFHTGSPGGTTWSTFAGRIYVRTSGASVNFGATNSTTVTYGSTNFAKNTTYLLVLKYTLNTSGNDPVSLWVFASGVPASEAAAGTPESATATTAGTDAVNAVGLRQGSSTTQPQTVVDGIRVGRTWADALQTTTSVQPGPGDIVINQLSPDYNGPNDEYIELVNKTNNNIDLSGFAIRYQAANGNAGTAGGTLSGTLLAKRYWLLSPNANVTVGQTNNLARDGSITAGMGGTAGQIALVRISDNVIIDAVGYGGAGAITGGTYTEGTAAAAPPIDGGLKRSPNGFDTNDNAADFVTVANAAIFLRSSSVGSPLPVKFTNLKAVQKGTSVYVSWTAATEDGISDYTVERSANGTDYAPVIKVAPTGNHQNEADYTVADALPVKGINYYRIRSTEMAGKTTFSNVLKLNTAGATAGLSIYPNPVQRNEVALQLSNVPAGKYIVRVIGADGRVFSTKAMTFTEGSSAATVSLNGLASGLYTLRVTGQVSVQQTFVKQ